MKKIRSIAAALAIGAVTAAIAAPPVEYVTVVRDANGKALANTQIQFTVNIIDDARADAAVLYSESHSVSSANDGTVRLYIGEGQGEQDGLDAIAWDQPRFMTADIFVPELNESMTIAPVQILGVPYAMNAGSANALIRPGKNGATMELTIDDLGQLSWSESIPTGDPAYDLTKVPEQLYFIGTFNNWNVAKAVEFTKLSPTRFTITRHLTVGEIFKFTQEQAWGKTDWSAQSSNIGSPNPMREQGNTPEFNGPEGDYTLTVDFFNYTLTITAK